MKAIYISIAILVNLNLAYGAILHGTIYGPDLEIMKNVIVTVNSTPKQVYISKDGDYMFNLPLGSYRIEAKHVYLDYYATENITIKKDGIYTLDLILMPKIDEIIEIQPNIDEKIFIEEKKGFSKFLILIVAIFLISTALSIYIYRNRIKKAERDFEEVEEELPEDLRRVVDLLERHGGRLTQKELRKMLPYSEAKVSLMIADLEERGIVKKIKRGRGNIIILKKFKR